MELTTMIVLGVIGLMFLFVIVTYNGLIKKKNDADNAFATIDVMLRQRWDLIPNLVSTVKQYAEHESNTLLEVTRLRESASAGKGTPDERIALDNQISKTIGGLMVRLEAYPQLRAAENFQQLQRSLNETEAQIAAARRTFNATATEYNTACQMFPTNIFAQMFNFKTRALLETPAEMRETPNVRNLFK